MKTKTKPKNESDVSYSMWLRHTEFQPGSYQSIEVEITGMPRKIFKTGDPVIDFYKAVEYIKSVGATDGFISSSVENFVMDEPDYNFLTIGNGWRLAKEGMTPESYSKYIAEHS